MNLKTIYAQIEVANMLPIEQQANAFFDVYNDIESFVEENKQAVDGKELTVEVLRELVKKEANIRELEPKFQFVFLGKEEQLIRLAEEFTDKFIADVGFGKKIDVLEAKKNICQRIPFLSNLIGEKGEFIPKNILKKFQNMTQEDRSKHLQSSFSEYIRHFYQKSIEIYGSAAARAALKKAYSLLQEKYSGLSAAIYQLLPEELLSEEEKYRILDDSYKDFASALINNFPEKFKKELLASLRDAEENISGNNDETLLQSSFSKFFELAYSRAKSEIGQEETERIFNIAYTRVEKAYAAYPIFMRILNAVPRGILEIERFNILSKADLEKVGRALKRTEVMKSEFTNIAAHELKTPIVPLKGFLSMMLDNPDKYGLNKKAQELLGYCLGSTERLEDLVGDILDISKLEGGEMKLQAIELNLAELLKVEIKKLSFLALEKKIAIKSKIPDSLKVNGDPNRLSQAVSNLIKNAIKFTDKGSVTVIAKLIGNNVQVDFIDTGIGLRKEDIPKLFTKFFQGQDIATRKTKGTGLGLAISKEIIEKHNGRIWAESRGLGKGSTFSFSLPVKFGIKAEGARN